MNNNEKFNATLNLCANPRQIYNALLAVAEAGYSLKSLNRNLEGVARQSGKEQQVDKNKFADRTNLLRVATELSKCKDPDRVLEVLNLALMRQKPEGAAQSHSGQSHIGGPLPALKRADSTE